MTPVVAAAVDLAPIVSGMQSGLADLTPANIMSVVSGGLVIVVPLFLTWFGIRWIRRRAAAALTKGSL